jgi:uncharacterized protein (TIGR02001 family)
MNIKRLTIATLGILAFASFGAFADEPAAPASATVGNLTLVSEYLFRGLAQTNRDPALQGGIEYDDASGFYVGGWGSNISWLSDLSTSDAPISSSLELDIYAGYRGKFGDDVGFDVGLYGYYYPGDFPSGFVNANTGEVYGSISYKIFSLKYSHTLTNLFGFDDTHGSGYLDASANYEFAPTWVLNAHVGRQRVAHANSLSYTDWKLGVTKNFDHGFSLALAYMDTNADETLYTNPFGHYVGRATGLLTLNKAF